MMPQPRIILFQLYGAKQPPDAEPLSIEILAAAARERYPQSEIRCIPLNHTSEEEKINYAISIIDLSSPNIIGISIPQSTYLLSVNLMEAIYRDNPSANVIIGHALPTYAPEIFLNKFPRSIIVRGWGEESFTQLIENILEHRTPLSDIPNLCFWKNGQLSMTLVRWPSKIIKPYRESPERFFSRVEASRGCHHDVCTFCTRPPQPDNMLPWVRRSTISIC